MNNPYTPESGEVPGELAGREKYRSAFITLLDGLERGYTARSQLITGMRGTGKTVLLREYVSIARSRRWAIVDIDAVRRDDDGFRRQLAFECRSALLAVSARGHWGSEAKRASGVLGSFASVLGPSSPLTADWTETTPGAADTGQLAADTTATFLALGEAARAHDTGIVFVIDELQRLTSAQLSALIDAFHRCYLRELPLTVVGAGLTDPVDEIPEGAQPPNRPTVDEVRSRADRLFEFPVLGALADADAAATLRSGGSWTDGAVLAASTITGRFPALLHALGFVVWDAQDSDAVTEADVETAVPEYQKFVDKTFFRRNLPRVGELDLAYLRAVVDAPAEIDTARALERTVAQCAETRAGLVNRGLLHITKNNESVFTTPHFESFLLRTMPTLEVPARKQRRRRYDP
ncbi:ATP-binding protein [Rhodococcus sp. 14-2470-1b]|uniref:ATP-binding protein n=1 Tax=Rhodococcus sp. 14-2470-1b TaxID=2023149 RepID=UPI000B9ABB21|nr:ATP-binding protein [Rhodococcus sp. 14-2470-1b]OZF54896.1 ATP-binding protein [Rhodococcus sp. 14-2470-1b]OZF54948.1 ATP-binding protein [Rhodococcus sp. 14-2470-1b]